MSASLWSTQQLAEFLAAVSLAGTEAAAAQTTVAHTAEELDAEVAAIVCGELLLASVGYPESTAPVAELAAVAPGVRGELPIPGLGACPATAVRLEHPPGARLVVARCGSRLSPREVSLLRGMAHASSLAMRMLHLVGEEQAARQDSAQRQVQLAQLASEQAALRRVATLVARSASPAEVLSAVASEVQDLLNADGAMVFRFEHDATATLFATAGADTPPGTRWTLEPPLAIEAVYRTGCPARVDDYGRASGQVVEKIIRPEKVRSSVASPIVVGGRLWGAIVIASQGVPLPTDTEQRMVDFTELVATAIANTQAREELRVIAEEQAALRRVATLVARGEPPAAVFAAVAGEVGQVLTAADFTMVGRYDPDHTVEVVGGWSRAGNHRLVGRRATLGGRNVSTLVFQRNQPARVDHFPDVSAVAVDAGELGMRSSLGAPISVEGRLWGAMIVASTHEDALPAGAEHQLAEFTDLVATAIANAQAREELRVIAEEQAALRRIATLVAHGEPPAAVFAAVAKEVGQILPAADHTAVGRYDPDRAFEVVGSWSRISSHPLPVGHRASLHGQTLAALVFDTGRPARRDSNTDVLGACAVEARTSGVGSAVAAPISVEGRVWGAIMVASTRQEPLAPETEERLADFTELVATAIAKAEAREELRRVANEQAALRRVATLVARAAPPAMVFTAVTKEVWRLCPAEVTLMGCYEPDDTVTIIAGWSATGAPASVGTRVALGGHNVNTLVFHTRRSARIDNYTEASGAAATAARAEGTHSVVGAPILVAGRLWGVVIAASTRDQGLAADTETRLAGFTELVATAIANADAHAQLTASRARVVATADHTRRRIERDLHDGAQQRLVSLALQLRMAQAAVPPQLDELAAELDRVVAGLISTLDELREIARGIHPAILADGGLAAALKVLARRASVPVRLDVRIPARLPERVEVTGYYVVSEALTNSAKHAHASTGQVAADVVDGHLRLSVTDDGVGGADPTRGTGLVGLTDRVEAIGGTLIMHSRPGQGTSLIVELPVDSG